MISQSHVLGSRHSVFSFCLMPSFVSRLLSHMAFSHVAGEIQSFTLGVRRFSFWWFTFVSEQQLAPRESSTLEQSVPARSKRSAHVLVLFLSLACSDADRFNSCCTVPSTLKVSWTFGVQAPFIFPTNYFRKNVLRELIFFRLQCIWLTKRMKKVYK